MGSILRLYFDAIFIRIRNPTHDISNSLATLRSTINAVELHWSPSIVGEVRFEFPGVSVLIVLKLCLCPAVSIFRHCYIELLRQLSEQWRYRSSPLLSTLILKRVFDLSPIAGNRQDSTRPVFRTTSDRFAANFLKHRTYLNERIGNFDLASI